MPRSPHWPKGLLGSDVIDEDGEKRALSEEDASLLLDRDEAVRFEARKRVGMFGRGRLIVLDAESLRRVLEA